MGTGPAYGSGYRSCLRQWVQVLLTAVGTGTAYGSGYRYCRILGTGPKMFMQRNIAIVSCLSGTAMKEKGNATLTVDLSPCTYHT